MPSWLLMPLVSVSGVLAAKTAFLSASISACNRALSCCSATCFLAPSLMCPMSTPLIALQNVVQSVWFSGTFSLTTSGSASLTCHMLLVPDAIPARLAKSSARCAKATCVHTSSLAYRSVFPKFSVRNLSARSSLSRSCAVFSALPTSGNSLLNAALKAVHAFFGVLVLLNHNSAGEPVLR